jgi:hypothetical protein
MLYMPRGVLHEAFALGCSSLHITVAVSVFRWVDLLRAALASVTSEDVRFREAVPVGSIGIGMTDALRERFEELLQRFAHAARCEIAFDSLSEKFIGDMSALPGGRFTARSSKYAPYASAPHPKARSP